VGKTNDEVMKEMNDLAKSQNRYLDKSFWEIPRSKEPLVDKPYFSPIPDKFGVGFTTMQPMPEMAAKYREERAGRYWNYHVTPDNWQWPFRSCVS
jgi:hypothetical protein